MEVIYAHDEAHTPPNPTAHPPYPPDAGIHTLVEVKRELQAHTEEGLAAGALQHVTFHVSPAILGANQGRKLMGFACPLQRVLTLRIKPNKLWVDEAKLWPGFFWPKKKKSFREDGDCGEATGRLTAKQGGGQLEAQLQKGYGECFYSAEIGFLAGGLQGESIHLRRSISRFRPVGRVLPKRNSKSASEASVLSWKDFINKKCTDHFLTSRPSGLPLQEPFLQSS